MVIGGVDLVASNFDLGQESPVCASRWLCPPGGAYQWFFLRLYAVIGLVERIRNCSRSNRRREQVT
jgi:hypothetical protein